MRFADVESVVRVGFQVELVQDRGQGGSDLMLGELSTDAGAWTRAERTE